MTKILLKCPKCSNIMKCEPRGRISGKKKACVYCGKSYSVEKNIV